MREKENRNNDCAKWHSIYREKKYKSYIFLYIIFNKP